MEVQAGPVRNCLTAARLAWEGDHCSSVASDDRTGCTVAAAVVVAGMSVEAETGRDCTEAVVADGLGEMSYTSVVEARSNHSDTVAAPGRSRTGIPGILTYQADRLGNGCNPCYGWLRTQGAGDRGRCVF